MISEVKNINKGNIIIIHPPVFVEKRCVGANRSLITKNIVKLPIKTSQKQLIYHFIMQQTTVSSYQSLLM